jgi:hypothetical protein
MDDKSPENMREAARAVGDLQMLTHFGGEFGMNDNGQIVDIREYGDGSTGDAVMKAEEYLPAFVEAMDAIDYRGWYSYELCHPLPVVNGQKVGVDFAEQCAAMACRLMKGLLS